MSFDVDEDGLSKLLTVSVVRPTTPMAFPADEYRLPSGFKGYALIVNITEFDQAHLNRKGAPHDTTYMKGLWGGLGFNVDSAHEGRITSQDLRNILVDFREKLQADAESISSIVTFIGSHGRDPDKILTSDMTTVDIYNDIVYQFDVNRCPLMNGKLPRPGEAREHLKPKLFFIQACRTEREEARTSGTPISISTDEVLAPSLTDAIVCYSTMPKTVSYKNGYGSFFAYCLTSVFMNNAYCNSLHELLQKTAEEVVRYDGKFLRTHRHAQVPTYKPYLLDATKLYFNMEALPSKQGHLKETLPPRLSYYVTRTVRTRNVLSETIFEKGSATFVFSEMSLSRLSALAQEVSAANSSDQLMQSKITSRFVVLNHSSHFEKICENVKGPVHLIAAGGDGKLRWLKSRGEVEFLQKCIANEVQQDFIREDDFCTSLEHSSSAPICIVDSPGMGKSMLLAEMGRRLKELHPLRAVIFLPLPEFIGEITRINLTHADLITTIQMALENLTCNVISKGCLQNLLQCTEKNIAVELLLDGFDEVRPDQRSLTYEILQTIRILLTSVRMWVTSRPHLLYQLERALNVLGHHICPFSRDDQVYSIASYWVHTRTDLNIAELSQFADQCIQNLHEKTSSKDGDIAGIPLQCLMIAEVFEEQAHIYAESDTVFCSADFQLNSIADMYHLLIQKKLDKYKKISGESGLEDELILKMHVKLAYDLLFPEDSPFTGDEIEAEEVLKVGLVEATDNNSLPKFIHRTFAEYLVTRYVADRLMRNQDWTEKLNKTLFDKLLILEQLTFTTKISSLCLSSVMWENFNVESFRFTSVFPVLLNCMLGNCLTVSESVLQRCHSKVYSTRLQLLYACIHSDCFNLAKFFVMVSPTMQPITTLPLLKPLEINSSTSILDIDWSSISVPTKIQISIPNVMEMPPQLPLVDTDYVPSSSCRSGDDIGVNFLSFHGNDCDTRNVKANNFSASSLPVPLPLVPPQLLPFQILPLEYPKLSLNNFQLEPKPSQLTLGTPYRYLDILQTSAQVSSLPLFQLTLEELQRFQDFSLECQWRTLQLAVRRGQVDVTQFLLNEMGLRKHFSDILSLPPEATALLHICILDSFEDSEKLVCSRLEIVRLLVKANPAFLEQRVGLMNNMTPLLCDGVHLLIILELIQLGANVFAQDQLKKTVLHSTKFFPGTGFHSLLMAISLDDLKTLVNVEDCDDYTPLESVLFYQNPLPETLKRFHEAGANFNRCDIHGYSVLATAIKKGRGASVLRNLIECGADEKWKHPQDHKNLLHCAIESRNLNAVKFLIHECGFNSKERTPDNCTIIHLFCTFSNEQSNEWDFHSLISIIPFEDLKELIHAQDDYGETPLHYLVRYNRATPKILNWFRETAADFNHCNKEGYSALAVALKDGRDDITVVQSLIDCGADVGWKSKWERKNLLHYAAQHAHSKVAEFLVKEQGFDINGRSWSFHTPLWYAKNPGGNYSPNVKTMEVLIGLGAK